MSRALCTAAAIAAIGVAVPSAADAFLFTAAGGGLATAGTGDGLPATSVPLRGVRAVAADSDGGFILAADSGIRRVGADGRISTIAGPRFAQVKGLAALPDGTLLATVDNRVVRVGRDGTTTTVAGSPEGGFSGDGGPATEAKLLNPIGVAVLPDGGFLIADSFNNRIRRVFGDGHIETVAGSGTEAALSGAGFAGDGGPAITARLGLPEGVAAATGGGFLIADTNNHRVRKVGTDGVIQTIAGTGRPGPAPSRRASPLSANLSLVRAVAMSGLGTIFVSTDWRTYAIEGSALETVGPASRGISATADGGALIAAGAHFAPTAVGGALIGAGDRILYKSVEQAGRLAVHLSTSSLDGTKPLVVRYLSSLAAHVTVAVIRGSQTVATASQDAVGGVNELTVADTLPASGLYRIEITAEDSAGAVASDRLGVVVAPLPVSAARLAAAFGTPPASDGTYVETVAACRRVAARRVDCRIAASDAIGSRSSRCVRMLAVSLRRDGWLVDRAYRCPFRRHPHFIAAPQAFTPQLEPPSW